MVTYNGRRVRLPVPRNLPLDLEIRVFSIPETGEWFLTYSSYLQRLDFYLQKSFRCEVTGNGGLTYFEAIGSEKRSTNFVEKTFSAGLRESIEKYVLSMGVNDVKTLVPMILKRFANDFTIGELVVRKDQLNKDSSEETEVTSTTTTTTNTTTHHGDYVVREKVSFDEIVDEDTGEVLIPGYSKYLLIERPRKTKSADTTTTTTKGLIVDSSQIQRKVPLEQHNTLMQWFCRIVINKKMEQHNLSLRAPNGEEKGAINELDNKERSAQEFEDTARNSDEPPAKKLKTTEVEDSETAPDLENTEKSTSTVKNALEDLYLPYQGSPNIFKNLYCLNSNLEVRPVKTLGKVSDHNIDKYTDKLLQCYQFLSTFQTVLKLAPFSLDQLVTSIKCTDPYELAGEKVYISTIGKENANGNVDISGNMDSPWKRNPKVRSYIESLSNDRLSYKILRNKPVPEYELDEIDKNGAGLFVYIILSLLGMLKDSGGKWRCHIPEEWIEDDIDGNNSNKKGTMSDQKDENDTLDGIVDKVLNFRSINWADRLSKGQFENGFWVIILLGVFQDSMHITKYTKIVENFTNAVLNKGLLPVIGFPKCMFRNFCRNLTIGDKVDVLWVLTDIVMNFSTDVHTALESSLKLSYELKYIREQLYRAKFKEEGKLTTMENYLQQLKRAVHSRQSFVVTEKERELAELRQLIAEMEESRTFLSKVTLEYEFINFKAIGMDRYGNRYYWFDLADPPSLDPEEEQLRDSNHMGEKQKEEGKYSPKYHSGRLWVKSPVDSIACWLLDITMEQLREWREVAKTLGKAHATKQVFKVYRKDNVYYKIDNDKEIPIVNSDGIINPEHQYTRIQRKIIDEGPENLLLLHEEWCCFDKLDDVGLLLSWLDEWGTREILSEDKFTPVLQTNRKLLYRKRN